MNSKKILLIRPDMIGDCLLITPAITLLKQRYPGAHICALANEYTLPIFKNNPDVAEIMTDPFFNKKIRLNDFYPFLMKIKSQRFDIAIHFYNEPVYALASFLARIPVRIGDKSKPLIAWLYNKKAAQNWNDLTLHEVENNLKLLSALRIDIADPPPLKLAVPPEGKIFIDRFKQEYSIKPGDCLIGIHLGTGKGNKPYPPERYARVIDLLLSNLRCTVVLTGSEKENALAREVLSRTQNKPVNLVGKTSLEELIGIISVLSVYVGVDTGPMHIAAALNRKIAAIFATKFVKPSRWAPWKSPNIIVRNPTKCYRKCIPSACFFDDCSREIEPAEIIDAVKNLLDGKSHGADDWFKSSLNIATNNENVFHELKANQYNIIKPGGYSFLELFNIFKNHDINVIHWTGKSGTLKAALARLAAIPHLPVPPLLVFDNIRGRRNHKELMQYYARKFQARRYF